MYTSKYWFVIMRIKTIQYNTFYNRKYRLSFYPKRNKTIYKCVHYFINVVVMKYFEKIINTITYKRNEYIKHWRPTPQLIKCHTIASPNRYINIVVLKLIYSLIPFQITFSYILFYLYWVLYQFAPSIVSTSIFYKMFANKVRESYI